LRVNVRKHRIKESGKDLIQIYTMVLMDQLEEYQ
jgi:hypothetical protein